MCTSRAGAGGENLQVDSLLGMQPDTGLNLMTLRSFPFIPTHHNQVDFQKLIYSPILRLVFGEFKVLINHYKKVSKHSSV